MGSATPSAWIHYVAAFEQRLRELGWIEGRTVAIVYRWAEGRPERYVEIAAEFVRLKVDVIVTTGGAVLALKQATSIIPIADYPDVNSARRSGDFVCIDVDARDLGGSGSEAARRDR